MATNPDNAVGTNAAYGGRTSVNAFNDITTAYSRGILSGWACVPNSGLTVSLGGDGTNRDVAIAEDNAGNKTSINNISGSPIDVTLSAAPASNSRIDAIVAYVDNPPNGTSTIVDNPEACGIIAVTGTVSASPTPPTENQIRTAITADGASGTTAYYVVLANITVVNGTTDITADDIKLGKNVNEAQLLNRYFSITNTGNCSVVISGGTVGTITDMRYALNVDGTFGKIYGRYSYTADVSTATSMTITVPGLNVESEFTINGACFYTLLSAQGTWDIINAREMVVHTDGTITVEFPAVNIGDRFTVWFPPCLYFFTDFGDTV